MQQLAAQLSDCGDRRAEVGSPAGVDSLGVESVTATVPAGSVTLVRRGDVVMQLIGPSADVATVATGLDATLAANLASCVNPASGVADAQRNPWLQGVTYVGLLADSEVRVPKQGPPAGTTAAPKVAIDAAHRGHRGRAAAASERPGVAAQPAGGREPANGAQQPWAEPESTVVQVPMVDKLGPGCGWAFTSASAPVVNEAAVAAERDRLREAARVNLVAQQQAWRPRVQAYHQQWADYKKRRRLSEVLTGGQRRRILVEPHQQPAHGVCAATAGLPGCGSGQDNFYAAQAQASRDYLNAVALCAIPVPDPTPTPTPTSSYVPEPSYTSQPSYGPQPTESSQPTGAPDLLLAQRRSDRPRYPQLAAELQPVDAGAAGLEQLLDGRRDRRQRSIIIGGMGCGDGQDRRSSRFARAPRPGCPAPRPAILDQAPPYVPRRRLPAGPASGPVPQLTDRRRAEVHSLVLKPLQLPMRIRRGVVGVAGVGEAGGVVQRQAVLSDPGGPSSSFPGSRSVSSGGEVGEDVAVVGLEVVVASAQRPRLAGVVAPSG